MTIDLRNFSLFNQTILIERYDGAYDAGGIYIRTLAESITAVASVQPYTTIEGDQVTDPVSGEWVDVIKIMYTTERIFVNDNTVATNTTSDIITVDGEKWQPMKIEPWGFLTNPHFRVLLARFDGF
jgi:hypothetical protein